VRNLFTGSGRLLRYDKRAGPTPKDIGKEVLKMSTRRSQQGFTLVEIAIVLVIIGLLIGGVLKGQEMITNAKISKVESDFKGISAAVLAYQDRYGFLPGDDPAAATRFAGNGVWSAADNGNGDGAIGGAWNGAITLESRKLWKHLRGAGFIKGPVDASAASFQQPSHAFGGLIGVQQAPSLYGLPGIVIVFNALPGNIDQILEARGDDGNPSTGSIRGHATQTAYVPTATYLTAYRF
jgi:prepilin-type N-terminal cleavage/methylation domain-containing protein